MLVSHVLLMLGTEPQRVSELLARTRRHRYRLLHGYYAGDEDDPEKPASK